MNGLQLLPLLTICFLAVFVNVRHDRRLDREEAARGASEGVRRHLWIVPSEPEAPSASPHREVKLFDWEREGLA